MLGFAWADDSVEVTLCNLVAKPARTPPAVVFSSNASALGRRSCGPIAFGACCRLAGQRHGDTLEVTARMDEIRGAGLMHVFADAARNYGVAYASPLGKLGFLAPSAQFAEDLPKGWNRYTWANLCGECGNVSAYVNSYRKQINKDGEPMPCCGEAVDETEGPPGPPEGAKGVFTAFRPAGQPPGPVVANVTFPWAAADFDGREPFQALLAPGLTASVLYGHPPRIYRARAGETVEGLEAVAWA